MDKALEFAREIKRKQKAVKQSNNKYLIKDYSKSIKRDIEELKYYCKQKGMDYKKLMSFCDDFINKFP